MMTTRLGIVAICAVLPTAASSAAQDLPSAPLVSSSDIIAIIGSDADARAVIAQVLADTARLRPTAVLASQIRREWLPEVEGAEVVRLADPEIPAFLHGCGRYWIITKIQRTQNVVRLELSLKCGCSTRGYSAAWDGHLWRVSQNGVGSGCPGYPPDCPCLGR
jgi:hypothetical protein